ncbi:MAG: hypothetical protein IT363_11235 [Methanoregulaceae archaeon]|nr:hypothetical protein [Methanoregulaceae archaeon]
MMIPVVLAVLLGVPQVKDVQLASLEKKSSLRTSGALVKYLGTLDLTTSAAMTWIPSREDYRGRRAFWLTCKDTKKTVVCEIGFIAWTSADDKANMASMLVSGGYFTSPIYSKENYATWKTLSQYFPRRGPNRWELIVIARSDSSIITVPVVERIFAFFGESIDRT